MRKEELTFRNMLNAMNPEFSEFLLEEDYKLLQMDGLTNINPFEFAKSYWTKPLEEVTANANANVGNAGETRKRFCNYVAETVTPVNKLSALYLFRKYGNKINSNGNELVKNIVHGNIYYHNLSLISLPYCIGLSTYPLITDGLTFGSLTSSPPKRPTSFTNQVIRFVQIASNHFAGATALTDYLQNYSYFTLQTPDYTEKERENDFQNLIHGISDEIRYAVQSPFVNVSISSPDTMRNTMGGYMWGDYKIENIMDEIMKNQSIYAKFIARGQLNKGEPVGIPYRFPITTLVADKSFESEYPEIWKEILEDNSNLCHLNIFNNMKTDLTSLSMCCRLSVDVSKLLGLSINNTFGSFLQIGSHGVCSINLPRIAYETKDETKFLEILIEKMKMARELLKIHREEILQKRRIKFHFFFNQGYLSLKKNFFSTIGFIGIANALEILGLNITEPTGLKFAKKILQTMKEETVKYSEEDNVMFNIEEVPAESASGTLAQKDKMLCKGTYDYYDSQFVPLSYDIDVIKRIMIEGELQEHCTGGSISHINLDGRPEPEALYKLTNTILQDSKLRQFAFNAGFTTCKEGHNSMGIYQECPTCHSKKVDWITRIVGYFTPVSSWNKNKVLEFKNRRWSKV
jgi:ribonucleoside-triphosphate reductase